MVTHFSRTERIAVALLPCFGGVFSMVGSGLIIYMVIRSNNSKHHRARRSQSITNINHPNNAPPSLLRQGSVTHQQQYPTHHTYSLTQSPSQHSTYHRFLLAMSVYTIMLEAATVVGPLAAPTSTEGYGALGNTASCSAQGFFFTMGLGDLVYNTGLSVYYILVVRYNVSNAIIVHRFEVWVHLWALVVSLTIGISGLIYKAYNPLFLPELGCWFTPYPLSCYNDTGETDTCQRGRYFQQFSWAFYSQQFLYVFIVIIMSALLFYTVRTQLRSMRLYASSESNQMKEQTRQVACQAFLFAAACLYVNTWPILVTIMFLFEDQVAPWILKASLYHGCFASNLQGCFNFLIYIRPRYIRQRRRHPNCARWRIVYDIIRGQPNSSSVTGDSRRLPGTTPDANAGVPGRSNRSLYRLFSLSNRSQSVDSNSGLSNTETQQQSQVLHPKSRFFPLTMLSPSNEVDENNMNCTASLSEEMADRNSSVDAKTNDAAAAMDMHQKQNS